jgi:hypothetical protein
MRMRRNQWVLFACAGLLSLAARGAFASSGSGQVAPAKQERTGGTFRLDSLCGPNCLWQVARAFGKRCSLHDVGVYAETSACRGTTVEGMLKACARLGLPAQAVRTTAKKLAADPRVAILLLEPNDLTHYVILDEMDGAQVRLLDATTFREMSLDELKSVWAGVAILIGNPPATAAWRHTLVVAIRSSALAVLLGLAAYSAGSWIAAQRIKRLPSGPQSA